MGSSFGGSSFGESSFDGTSFGGGPLSSRWSAAAGGTLPVREFQASGNELDRAVARTRDWLLGQQHPEGHFVAELEGDTILESEFILLLAFLGRDSSPEAKAAGRYLLSQQREDGGWSSYPGGPTEISGSCKAYLALKLLGYDADSEPLMRARAAILRAGGVERVNSFTRYYFAMLGLIPYDLCPAVPPELMLIPDWAPFNIYEMSAWSRTIVVPLSLLWAFRPQQSLADRVSLNELFANPRVGFTQRIHGVQHSAQRGWLPTWETFFHYVDQSLKTAERWGLNRFTRPRSIRLAEQWILDRLRKSDGLGAIFPPIVWTLIALRCLGYADDHPAVQQQFVELEKLYLWDGDRLRLQPCLSPVWDTAISLIALRDAGVSRQHPAIQGALNWLLSKEVREPGDWSRRHPQIPPAGWFFEFNNEFYPDVDDTAMVLIALGRCLPEGLGSAWSLQLGTDDVSEDVVISGRSRTADEARREIVNAAPMLDSLRRGVRWLLAMQSRNGGWGAFDSDNTRELFTKVPFADHNAMIDPPTADISARVLEAFCGLGMQNEHLAMQRAMDFITQDQQPDGSWYGRWGVNYIYGTWQVLVGLDAMGVPHSDSRMRRGVAWLNKTQQANGGWGETAMSYDDPSLAGMGPTTASQTAWAVLGLLAAGEGDSAAVRRGIEYLISTQLPDGTWDETEFTGTGFPRVFYLRYHYYRIYFPLMALSRYARYRMALSQTV